MKTPFILCAARIFAENFTFAFARNRLQMFLVLIVLSGAVVLAALLPHARGKVTGGTTTRNRTEKSGSKVKVLNNAFDFVGASDTAALIVARKGHTATLLSDGEVLVVGGENQNGFVAEAEIFDPATGIFNFSGNLNIARADHTATLLSDGRVLISGGRSESGVLNNTEIFDPTNRVFSNGPNLTGARTGESATLISDGRIVFAGGDDSGSVEIYNPSTNSFTLLQEHLPSPRSFHGAASLNDGRILFVGGVAADGSGILSGEILNIATHTFESVVNSLTDEHVGPTLHVLPDGKVQIIGGSDHEVMEIYDPATNQFGAHAHLYPNGDDDAELLRQLLAAGSRAALFRLGSANALTNRAGHAITELAGCNHALITGGVDSSGAILNTAAVVSSSRATITTDKLDYSPGTPVIVTGTGWQPLEFVTVIFHEDPHVDTENPHTFIAQANAYGNFTDEQYAPEEADKGVTFILAAEGASSLRTAQTTFTDASPGSLGNYATVGLSGTTAPAVVAASNVAANVTFSNLSRGSGLTASAATDAFNSSSWPTTTSLTVAGNTDYYEFTITPNASYRFSASELRVGLQRSSAGPAFVELRSSLDSFGSTIGSVISVGTSLAKFSVNLSAVPGLQNRASGVTFRLYGYNASSGGGTLRIQQILSPAMVGLEVDGVVTSAGSLQLSSSTYSDSETNVDHTFNIPVTRTGGSGGAVSVNFSVTDDTATTGDGDYTISPASGTLHWADGDSSSKNIAITVKGDAKYEADETINVSISSPDGGATLGSPANAVVTITNDDAQPSLSIDDVTQSEGNSGTTAFIFTVSKIGSTAFDVLLDYATQDGTTPLFAATAADNDYLATSGSVTIGANETTRTITVAVQGDTHIENDETFFINLSNATGATIAHSQGVGTIQNDDALFASDDNYNTEEDTPLNIGASGVLSNDSESGLTAVLISGPSHATSFNMNIDGSFTYTPAANYNGTDHFTYKAKNTANVESNVATVTLTITAVNDAPFAVDDSATIDEDMPKNFTPADLKSNDTDVDNTNAQLSVTAVSSPVNGNVVLNGDGTLTFVPAPNFSGMAGFDYTVSDGNLTDAGHVTITVTPINDAPVITSVTPVSQSKQYSDPINAVTINAADVDSASLSISITNLPAGINGSGGCTAAGAGTTCSWTLTGNLAAAPNTYVVGIKTSDGASCDNSTATIIVLKEDAHAYYSGAVFASTTCPTCGAATVTLSATIKDITAETGDPLYDSFAGDIRNATVTFINRDTNTPIATVAVGLVNGGDTKVGTATYNWLLNIGSADSLDVTIGIIVNNYYTRNSSDDNTVIEVAKPLNNFITGGGFMVLSDSAGLKAGDPGTKNNFGFNVKYNSSGRNLQGNINTIIRRLEGGVMHVYQVKGNSMTSLSVNLNITASHPLPTATFNGKASIHDITNPESPVSVDGNATLQVTMADRGEPGGADSIAITVWNKSGGLWFASHWNSTTTLEKVLAGGNLIVH